MPGDALVATLVTTTRTVPAKGGVLMPAGTLGVAVGSPTTDEVYATFYLPDPADPGSGTWAWESVSLASAIIRTVAQDEILDTYLAYLADRRFADTWAADLVQDLVCLDRDGLAPGIETAWSVLLDLITRTGDESLLCDLGVSILEVLLNGFGAQFIDRVEQQAAVDPRFVQALSCVWPDGDVYPRVMAAIQRHGGPR